ncbi:hypothetical protein AB0D57_39935 [Streptomyces sp. NPDC048275]|uniref:hypothetical protein n=1 Tax=Streptomyces sp. NPDC048275 TaxID=3155629 RepID=UPI0033E38CF7
MLWLLMGPGRVLLSGFAPEGGIPGVLGVFGLFLAVGWGLGWVLPAPRGPAARRRVHAGGRLFAVLPLVSASGALRPRR